MSQTEMREPVPKQIAPASGTSTPATQRSREADACKIITWPSETSSFKDFQNT